MKKILFALLAIMTMALIGCDNQQVFGKVYFFNYAIIKLPNGEVVEGKVQTWNRYEGEQLQVVIDGITYMTNSKNVAMIAE